MGSWLWAMGNYSLVCRRLLHTFSTIIIFLDWILCVWNSCERFSDVSSAAYCTVCELCFGHLWVLAIVVQELREFTFNKCSLIYNIECQKKKTKNDLLQAHLKPGDEMTKAWFACIAFLHFHFFIKYSMLMDHGYIFIIIHRIHPFWLNVNYGCNCRFDLMRPYCNAFH